MLIFSAVVGTTLFITFTVMTSFVMYDLYCDNCALRNAIANHRDQKADDRCWLDDQELYKALGDGNLGDNRVGDKCEMLESCKRFLELRCEDGGPWRTSKQLLAEIDDLNRHIKIAYHFINTDVPIILNLNEKELYSYFTNWDDRKQQEFTYILED